jgi:hypothetical protein
MPCGSLIPTYESILKVNSINISGASNLAPQKTGDFSPVLPFFTN